VIANISIGTAYSEATAFIRREKRLIAPLVLALLVVPVSVAQLIQPLDPLARADGMAPWMVVALVALVIQLVGQMAISRLAMGWPGALGGAIALAFRRFPAAFAAIILFILCLSLVLVPMIMIVMIAGGTGPGIGALINLLTLAALFAAAPRIILVPTIAMSERLGPWALLKRGWATSRGHYWRLLGFFLLFLIASLVLALAISTVVGSLAVLAFGAPDPLSISRLALALAGGVVQGIAATLYAAMVGRILVQMGEGSSSGM
jgi:hypothetical protein